MKQMSNLSSDQTPSHIASSKEKIDAIFGITGGKSVDDFLDELSLDTNKIQQTMANIDSTVKDAIDGIDNQMSILTNSTNDQTSILSMKDMELSLKEIEEMVQLSKQIFKHISDSILATDLIDSELVHSAAVLMEGIHINISEFVSLYKSKQNFIDKVKEMKDKIGEIPAKLKEWQEPLTMAAILVSALGLAVLAYKKKK